MTDNSATVKIVANHIREYNELDTRYKKLGVKLIFSKREQTALKQELIDLKQDYKDLKEQMRIHVERFVDMKILLGNLKAENKRLRGLIDKQRLEFMDAIDGYLEFEPEGSGMFIYWLKIKKGYEEKLK